MPGSAQPPVLITSPSYAGSLAAVRLLGRAGISVAVGGRGMLEAARWSRLSKEFWPISTDKGQEAFLADMTSSGKRSRGHVLMPTSDMTAWLFSRYNEKLSEDFVVYAPPFSVIETILDKERLWQACKSARIPTVATWFPKDSNEVAAIGSDLRYPILIKPRSHVFNTLSEKGVVVHTPKALATEFADFVAREAAKLDGAMPSPRLAPILQYFVEDAIENVVSVSGFIDRTGKRSVIRASRKVLQRSRPVGVGLAFESIEVDPKLAKAAIDLCRELRYFGIFEIEFVPLAGVWRLIDFNPRFYQEMALEIAAGAPLPLLAYFDACGDEAALDKAIAASSTDEGPHLRRGFTDMFTTSLMLVLRFLRNPLAERKALHWHWSMRGRLIDATFDRRDPLPSIIHALSELRLGVRAVPRFAGETKRMPKPALTSVPRAVGVA